VKALEKFNFVDATGHLKSKKDIINTDIQHNIRTEGNKVYTTETKRLNNIMICMPWTLV
jgi:hypothetical protein